LTDRLQEELGVIAASFALAGAMGGGGAVGVATQAAPIVEEKTTFTLLLVLLLFLRLYCSYNKNTRKEK
jgi:hypothetical protein